MCTVTQQDPEKAPGERPAHGLDPIEGGPPPPEDPSHGHGGPAPRPPGSPEDQHPEGTPPEPADRQLSEGPSGPDQAGYEHAGYAPGYGESDLPGAGAGSRPGGSVVAGSEAHDRARHDSDNPPPGGYGPQKAAPSSWGKVLGIGFGALLILLLLGAGCMSLAMFTVSENASTTGAPHVEAPETTQKSDNSAD